MNTQTNLDDQSWNWSQQTVDWLSTQTGAEEGAIRLIIGLLIAYPIQMFYSFALSQKSRNFKNVYFLLTGLAILLFNYGFNTLHLLITALTVYTTLCIFKGNRLSIRFNFVFTNAYLLIGYYSNLTNEYSFEWTIPHCVLTLRLIGLSFDYYDAQQKLRLQKKFDSDDQTKQSQDKDISQLDYLEMLPDFTEFFAYSFFPSSVLVGPQFDLQKYQHFIQQSKSSFSPCASKGLKKLSLGLLYMTVFQLGSHYLPVSLLHSEYYTSKSFFMRIAIVALVTRVHLYKYISSWLLSEGACIASGLTYETKTNSFWPINNVEVLKYETTCTFTQIIQSFNITTNAWCAKYIYKRLKFLKMKLLSHFATLAYLAVWHGWKSGYYVTFLLEFVIVLVEKDIKEIIQHVRNRYRLLDQLLENYLINLVVKMSLHLLVFSLFGYCLVPFILLSHKNYLPVISGLYYFGHIISFSWLIFSPFILSLFRHSSPHVPVAQS